MSAARVRAKRLTLEQVIVLIYLRVSSSEQADEGLSLPNQLRDCHRYAARQTDWIAGDTFQDVLSGRKDDRPGYRALKLAASGHALAGRRVIVLVQRLDRLGRNMKERVDVWNELETMGAELHSDAEGRPARFVYNIYAAAADEESRLIGDRIVRVWDGLEEKGWRRPGRVAWGYDTRPRTDAEKADGAPSTVLVPHPEQAPYARELWRRYAGGESGESLGRWTASLPASARGTRAASGGVARRLKGNAIRQLLSLPVYVGRIGGPHDLAACVEDGERCPVLEQPRGRWEPLVDDATWIAAHARYALGRRLPAQASGQYLLSGLVRCPDCGYRMSGNPGNGRRAERDGFRGDRRDLQRYICAARHDGDDGQRTRPCYATVHAGKIEAAVLETVVAMVERVADRRFQPDLRAENARLTREYGRDDGAAVLAGLERDLDGAEAALVQASLALFDGRIPQTAYDVMARRLGEDVERISAEIARRRGEARTAEPVAIDALVAQVAGWAANLAKAAVPAQRAALGELLAWVRPVRVGRGRYEVSVSFTALGLAVLGYAVAVDPTPNLVAVRRFGTTNWWTATMPARPARARFAS